VKRVYQSRHAVEAKRLREKAKVEEYVALTIDVISRKKSKDWSESALELTSRLLQLNPEFYTIWNYRRTVLLMGIFPKSSAEKINNLIADELSNTMSALKSHPKVYWIWNHRRWCLENTPHGPGLKDEAEFHGWRKANWDRELFVVEKMLDADPRNFHAWDYRRYALASMSMTQDTTSEFNYTTRKIEANFSNFSAWHQRSKVISALQDSNDIRSNQEVEFDLLRNAMYTDPNDQSVWVYHRWLIGLGEDKRVLEREITAIQELLHEQPDSKWCIESIVYYKRLLLRKHAGNVDVCTIVSECRDSLQQLELLDPMRRQRYQDIAKSLTSLSQ